MGLINPMTVEIAKAINEEIEEYEREASMGRFSKDVNEEGTAKMERKILEEEAERLESLHAYMILDEGEPCMVWAESRAEFDGPAIRLSDRAICAYICEAMIDQSKMFHSLTETMEKEVEVNKQQMENIASAFSNQVTIALGEDANGAMVCAGDVVKNTETGDTGIAISYEDDCFTVSEESGNDVKWAREVVEKQMLEPVTEATIENVEDVDVSEG